MHTIGPMFTHTCTYAIHIHADIWYVYRALYWIRHLCPAFLELMKKKKDLREAEKS